MYKCYTSELPENPDFNVTSANYFSTDYPVMLLSQGAEARTYKVFFYGKMVVVKERFSKKYRHPFLDTTLNNKRIKAEIRCLMKCKQLGIRTPAIYFVDLFNNKIYMELIQNSITIKKFIADCQSLNESRKLDNLSLVAQNIGSIVASLHNENIVHGDLTTSNFLINTSNCQIVVIDFGLGSTVSTIEDKAVDLYVLERAILSSHPNSIKFIEEIMKSYCANINKSTILVIKKLEEVRLRGRKRTMVG